MNHCSQDPLSKSINIAPTDAIGAQRPLVTIAKIASPPPFSPQDALIHRFYLQSLARELLPTERVSQCLRAIVPGQRTVDVMVDRKTSTAHYKNLITCGRVWQCPVCASKITEKRADELLAAVTKWQAQGGFVALLTFTLRHNKYDRLVDLLKALRKAHSRFKSGAPFQRLRERYNWVGSVSALEVTYGENGWHPHLHELVFFEPLASSTWHEFTPAAKARWLTVLAAEGATATYEHGLDVRDADTDVYDYVAKFGKLPSGTTWTVERELAKAPVKRAHQNGMTPFQMLEAYGDGDQDAGRLFQEYAAVFKGRNQLVWSRGLRALLEMDEEAADEELAELLPDEVELLASLSRDQWRSILRMHRDIRAELLLIAGHGRLDDLEAFLQFYQILPAEVGRWSTS